MFSKRKKQKIKGTSDRPRLSVFRSNVNIFAQLINDVDGVTLCAASSLAIKSTKTDAAKEVGKAIAILAVAKNIKRVVFDRGAYSYRGRIKELANSARENGLEF